ncbi:MAG: phytoene desaturase [Flavobacteriales bacterium]|jgi:phytoene desaturase
MCLSLASELRFIELKKSCAVIGSGVAGLATAIRMAVAGYQVTVFEANDKPGGKMSEFNLSGFRFDKGPTVLTKPEYLDDLFRFAGKEPRDYWNCKKVDPIFNYYFEDGTLIRSHSDWAKFANEVAEKTSDSGKNLVGFLEKAKVKHDLTDEVFLQRSLHKFRNYLNWETLKGVVNFHKIEAFRSMNASNQAHFNDQKLVDIFNRYASYNGSDPYLAPATLNVISHYEITTGTYFSEGGIYSIVSALYKLALELKVDFRFDSAVRELTFMNDEITGVVSDKGAEKFDVVISNVDVHRFYTNLVPKHRESNRFLKQERSSSVIVFYWGLDCQFGQLGLHNMFLTVDSEAEYKHIRQGRLFEDPTIHLTISSKGNSNDAPEGCENWAVLISTPHNTDQNWDELIEVSRKRVLAKLQRILNVDVSSHITVESVQDPRTLETETGAAYGAVFGSSSNSMLSAFMRHPNFSSRYKNLFFCGGTVHPGPGVPLCLLSAKIATEMAVNSKEA